MNRRFFRIVVGTALLGVLPMTVDAQHVTSPGAALEVIRRGGSAEPAGKFLAQEAGAVDDEALERLADGLTQIAVEFDGNDANVIARKRAVGSVTALEYAGSRRAAVRYGGSLARLRRIVEEGRDKPVRSLALQALLSVTDSTSLIPYLVTLASSDDPIADHAVSMLVRYTGPAGRSELRRLHNEKKVVEPNAKELLAVIASANEW